MLFFTIQHRDTQVLHTQPRSNLQRLQVIKGCFELENLSRTNHFYTIQRGRDLTPPKPVYSSSKDK